MSNAIVITGGAGNLGIHLCRFFLNERWHVFLGSRTYSNATKAAEYILENHELKNGINLVPFEMDLRDKISISNAVEKIFSNDYKIYGLVNNAAVDNQESIDELSYEHLTDLMNVNFCGSAYFTMQMIQKWKQLKSTASIVNVSSLLATMASPKSAAYSASKAALEAFSRCTASEVGKNGIRLNTVRIAGMKGNVIDQKDSQRIASFTIDKNNEKNDFLNSPLRRGADFEEFCNVIKFLISDRASYITGQEFNVDGGISSTYPNYSI